MAEIKWIKIAINMFDHRKIKQIESMPGADATLVIWIKLLCLAGNINESGMILMTREIPYNDKMLAHEFSRPLNAVRAALETFQRFGMVEIINDVYCISNWEKYQNIDSMDKVKEQARLRNIEYRQRKQQTDNDVTRDVTMTSYDATDKELDKDKDKELDKDIYKKYKIHNLHDLLADLSPALSDEIEKFVDFRKSIKSPMTAQAVKLLLTELSKLSADEGEQIEILHQSILNGWKSVYAIKGTGSRPIDQRNAMPARYTDPREVFGKG